MFFASLMLCHASSKWFKLYSGKNCMKLSQFNQKILVSNYCKIVKESCKYLPFNWFI